MCDKKKSTLDYIQEMFEDKVDEDVIKLVLTECQNNVDKTVMQLLSLSESTSGKNNVRDSSSLHRLDDIDPVDTPLPTMLQYLSPETKDCTADHLNFSMLLPKTQFSDETKPVSPSDNPNLGTARPLFPNHATAANESLVASNTFLRTGAKVQSDTKLSDTKLSDEFNENEMYVSDDDIDEHIDSIDDIDTIDQNDKVDHNSANHSMGVKDENISRKVEQSVNNTSRSKNTEHQSFQNGKTFRANKPQQKQVNIHNGSSTTRHPIRPQFNMPQTQSSYFANQARYFPTFASSPFPHPFIGPRGNMPPVQYQGPPRPPMFRPPMFNQFTPDRAMIFGNKGPNHQPTTLMTNGSNEPNHPMPITSTHGNKGPNQPFPVTPTHGNKGLNYFIRTPMTTSMIYNNQRHNHPIPINSTHGNKGPTHPAPTTTSMTYSNKGSNHPMPTTTSMAYRSNPNHPMPINSTHGNKGPSHPIPVNVTHGNKGPSHPMPITSTYGNRRPNHFSPTTTPMYSSSKGSNHSMPMNSTHVNKGPSHPVSVNLTHGKKEPNNPIPITSTSTHGNKALNHSAPTATPITYGNKGSNHKHKGYHSQSRMPAKFPPQEKKLIILRGLPGSGKSTLARHLGGMIISTDDFFTKQNGYTFNPIELTAAHEWNQARAKSFMKAGFTPLVVDNTNTQSWEMRPYVLMGLKCGYKVDIIEPDTSWKWNIKELERRNTHGVQAKTLENMLERYEKNVTVDSIAKTTGQPIISTSKPDEEKPHGNAVKRKTDNKHCTSSGSKPLKESEKMLQANGKSETRRPATTKRTIALSANFSAPPNRSKRSFRDSTMHEDKQNATRFSKKTASKMSDITGNPADMNGNNESNLDEMVTSKDKGIPVTLVPSIDAIINEQETSEEGCVVREDMINVTLKSNPVCAVEAPSHGSNSDLCEHLKIGNGLSGSFEPGATPNNEIRDISKGNDDSKREPSVDDMHPKLDTSVSGDHPFVTEDISEISSSQQLPNSADILDSVHENENKSGEPDIYVPVVSSQLTLSGPEHSFSVQITSVEPDVQVARKDVIVDVRLDHSEGISDRELTESFTRKKQDTDLDCSKSDIQSATTDNVSPLVHACKEDAGISVVAKTSPNLNNQELNTQCDTLALLPLTDSRDSTSAKYTGTVLQTDVPLTDNEDTKILSDVQSLSGEVMELGIDSSSPYNDLHSLEDELRTIYLSTTSLEKDPCAGTLGSVNDMNNSVDMKEDKCDSIVDVENKTYDSCGVEPDLNCKNTEPNLGPDVFDVKADTPDANCGIQEPTSQADTECVKTAFTNAHDSHAFAQQTKRGVQEIFVDANSDERSNTKFDAPNTDGENVCKSNAPDTVINHQGIDIGSITLDNVEQDPSITSQHSSCEKDFSSAVDLCTVIQSSNNDLEQANYENLDTVDSVNVDMDPVDVQFPDIKIGDPLIDRAETNVKDGKLDLQTLGSSVQAIESDTQTPSLDENDSLDPIQLLVDCFPHTEINLLKSFLNSCDGDLVKTVDSILEHKENVYQSVHSVYNDSRREGSTGENLDINSPTSLSSTERTGHDLGVSPNINGEVDVASRNLFSPEENRNSYGATKVESPISTSSTPKKFQDVSVDSLQLTLDPALALQLLEMFGAFSGVSAKDPLSETARSIKIDKEFARILHTKWRKTVQATNKAKKIEEAKKFSPVSGSPGSTRRKFKTPPRQFYLPDPSQMIPAKSVGSQPEPVSLKEIMDEQLAIHVSQSDQEVEKRFLEEQLDLSTKLKRSRLHGMFPGVDAVALNEIFQANNYDLDTTILQVQSSCGMPLTGSSTAVSSDQQTLTNYQSPSNRQWSDFSSEGLAGAVPAEFQTEVDGNFQSLNDPSYQDYRAEAQTHFELRADCIKKAALAYSKKQGELAKVYADQARHHGEKIKEANLRAAEKILESRNHDLVHSNTLDLHELHVNEAIQVLDNVLEERRKERRSPNRRSPSYLQVITGRGNRSRDGKPRIKPAVVEYLKRNGYRYEELNSGLYRVFLN